LFDSQQADKDIFPPLLKSK